MNNRAFLGIDASKGYSDFVLLNESFEALSKPVQFDDTRAGHQALASWLTRCIGKHNLTHIYAGVESTGGFENNWHAMCMDLGMVLPLQITRLNPSVVKDAAKATLATQVTDALSASHIAHYLIRYGDQVIYQQPETKYRSFRSLDRHIRLLVRQRSQLISQLKQLLYSCFPELQRFCKQGVPNWVLELLIAYPTPQKLARARVKTLAKIPFITAGKAQTLIGNAKQTVAARGNDIDGLLIASLAGDIQARQKRISQLKKVLTDECAGEEIQLLDTLPGVAAYSAAAIMIQIEDIRRFATPSQLAGYFGIYPVLKQSGDKKPVIRMSKKGRAAMRATLYMCANSAVLKDPHLKKIYHNHRGKGKSHKQALGVLMHKLLRIVWGVLTHKTAYNHKVDKENQQRHPSSAGMSLQKEIASKRRHQKYDEQAPISRIAAKKRKVYQQSQVSDAEQVRDHIDTPLE